MNNMRTEITNNGYYLILDNGYHVSVIGGKNFYGDGKTSFEVGMWVEDGDCRTTILVQGWMTDKEINELVETLSKFQ